MNIKFRHELINYLIQQYNLKNYLEIGIDNGFNYNKIICTNKISVDPASGQYSYATPTFKMTSDDFFKHKAKDCGLFDIIFIDGLHHSDQVDKDIANSISNLSAGGFIILHDCNPLKKEDQIIPRNKPGRWNGDVWKSIVTFRNSNSKLGCIVLNTDEGLGIISDRIPKNKKFNYNLEYELLEQNRKEYLGLIESIESII